MDLEMKNAPEGAFLHAFWRSGRHTNPNSGNSNKLHFLSEKPDFRSRIAMAKSSKLQ
jgi:hypothetical protein